VLPVNVTLSIPGCLIRYSPASPYLDSTYNTPGGKPAYFTKEATLKADRGVFSDVFRIEQHPVANTGPHFHASIISG